MKSLISFLLASSSVLLASCASDAPTGPEPTRAERYRQSVARGDEEEGSRPPRLGMTKDEVLNRYGEPASISAGKRGEVWGYVFNNFDGRSFIPYYGPIHDNFKRRHSGTVIFDASGRVRDYHWNQSNPKGATIWR